MEFGVDKLPGSEEESWYFSGEASMNLKGAIDKVEVKVSFEKPSPPQNCTGIRYAKITIKMAGGCRIPIGSTPLFISGFEVQFTMDTTCQMVLWTVIFQVFLLG